MVIEIRVPVESQWDSQFLVGGDWRGEQMSHILEGVELVGAQGDHYQEVDVSVGDTKVQSITKKKKINSYTCFN